MIEQTTIGGKSISQMDRIRFDDELDLKLRITEVHDNIGEHLGSDFVLTKFEDRHIEGTIDLFGIAELTQFIIQRAIVTHKPWRWNYEEKQWEKTPLEEIEVTELKKLEQIAFNIYMNPMKARAILQRNKRGNWMVDLLLGGAGREEGTALEEAKEKTKGLIKTDEK